MRSSRGDWPRLWSFVRPYRLKAAATLLLALAATPLALLAPLPLKIAVDSVIGNHPMPWGGHFSLTVGLAFVAALLIAITLLMYVQGLLAWLAQMWLGQKPSLDLRAALFRHAQRLSLTYRDRAGATDSVYRIQCDAQSLQFVLINGLIPLGASAVTLCGMVIVTARLDRQLAIVETAVCPLLYWITGKFNQPLRERWYGVKDPDSSAMSVVQEVLSSVRVVKAFGREEHEHARFVSRSKERLMGKVDLARRLMRGRTAFMIAHRLGTLRGCDMRLELAE